MDSSHRFIGIGREELDQWWPQVSPVLATTFARTEVRESLSDILAALRQREAQLWIELDGQNHVTGAAITRLVRYPAALHAQVHYGAGELQPCWREWLGCIEDWGRQHGCDAVDVMGRKGWEKAFAGVGYSHAYTVIRKTLT